MTHEYYITGMTCANCVTKVKSELLKLPEVINAKVQQETPQATITMNTHIPLSLLQDAVGKAGNYSISEVAPMNLELASKSLIMVYKPLLLVFAYILGVSFLVGIDAGQLKLHEFMSSFMAGFFIVFSFFKMLDLRGFADSYSTYDLLAKRWRPYGFLYPFLELLLGILFLTNTYPFAANAGTIILMGFSSIGVIQAVANKRRIQCACLGAVFNLPMSTITIIEDLLMVAMALVMLFI